MRYIIVELEDGTQDFFDTTYEGFKYAKEHETRKPHSVAYVAVGEFETEDDHVVYVGNVLRIMLRSLDNIHGWLRAGNEGQFMDA